MERPGFFNKFEASTPPNEKVNPLTAKFDEDLEDDFQDSIQETLLQGHRRGLVVLALVCAVYALLDWMIMPELRYLVWSIRFLGVLPFAMAAIMFTYWKPAQDYSGFLSVGCLLLSSGGTLTMMFFAPPAVSGAYFAGLLIHIMLCYGILRLEFITSLICGSVILVAYNAGALMFTAFSKDTLLMHNFIFITGIALGCVQSYTRNQMVRDLFIKERGRGEIPAVVLPEPDPQPAPLTAVLEDAVFKSIEIDVLNKKADAAESKAEAVSRELRLEQELKDAGQLFNLFMERISDVVWFADPDGTFLYVSPSSERVWGHSSKDLVKKSFKDLLTRDSFEYFNAEIKAASRMSGGTVRPLDLEIMTKSRVIKTGETVALAFQDHETFGSGIIGVTRDMTYRRRTEAELKKFNEELEGLIKKRSGELEDTLKRLRGMEEAMKATEDPDRMEELPVIRYLRGNLDALHRQIVQLQDATRQLHGIYSIKAMKKEDLEQYLQGVNTLTGQIDAGLRDSIDHLYQEAVTPQSLERKPSRKGFNFRLGDYIEQVLIGFGSRFRKTGHMVEIDCPDAIVVFGDPELYSQMLKALVGYSLDIGLAGITGGGIDIQVTEDDADWVIRYKDNGKGLTAEALDQLFDKPYQENSSESSLQKARDIVRDRLDGEFRLNSQDGTLIFEIVIPKDQEMIA